MEACCLFAVCYTRHLCPRSSRLLPLLKFLTFKFMHGGGEPGSKLPVDIIHRLLPNPESCLIPPKTVAQVEDFTIFLGSMPSDPLVNPLLIKVVLAPLLTQVLRLPPP